MEKELIELGFHKDYANIAKAIYYKHARESIDSPIVLLEDDYPLVVEELYNLFMEIHKDVL